MGREFFGALVRFGGLILVTFGLFDCWHIAARLMSVDFSAQYSIAAIVYGACTYFLFGFGAIRGAGLIEKLCYGAAGN